MRLNYWAFRFIIRTLIVSLLIFVLFVPLATAIGHWSPGGNLLAFSTPTIENYEWTIMLMDTRSRITLPVSVYAWRLPLVPVWSPDGAQLAWSTFRPQSDIFVHDIATGITTNLTRDIADDRYPSWSPDSRRLLYYSNLETKDERFQIYSIQPDGTQHTRLTEDEAVQPAFSPDGEHILFSGSTGRNIYRMRPDGSDQQRLTSSVRNEYNVVWSPEGTQFAFVGFVNSPPHVGRYIFVMDSDCAGLTNTAPGTDCSAQPRMLLPEFRAQGMPQWSPDSRFLAFVGRQRSDTTDGLYVLDTTTDEPPRKLAEKVFYAYVERWPMWSPDSRYIAYSHRDLPGLYMVEVTTGNIQQLSHISSAYPVWQP